MLFRFRFLLPTVAGTALLGGCAVYVPITPSTPLVSSKGEVEVTAALRGLTSLEASGAWSPAAHVVVTAETALQVSNGHETSNTTTVQYTSVHKQVGVGVGTYRLVGAARSVYLGATGGVGFAKADIYDPHADDLLVPLLGKRPTTYFDATYQRYYGQLYAAHRGPGASYGVSARGTFVHYSRLLRNGEAITSPTHFYLEPTLFVRAGRGPLQFQGTLGLSMPVPTAPVGADQRNLSPATLLISAGVVLRPHLLGHRAAQAPAE